MQTTQWTFKARTELDLIPGLCYGQIMAGHNTGWSFSQAGLLSFPVGDHLLESSAKWCSLLLCCSDKAM